jgi:hypothetical protein
LEIFIRIDDLFQCPVPRYHYVGLGSTIWQNIEYMVFDRELNLDKCDERGGKIGACKESSDERVVEDTEIKKRVTCYHKAGTKHQHCNSPVISSISFWENLAITF